MINGVAVLPLKRICNEQGCVFKMLSRDDAIFQEFGEIYFSSVNKGVIKGWNIHKESDVNLACLHGRVKLVLYDTREKSPTKNFSEEVVLGNENYALLHVPPGVAVSFRGLDDAPAILANCQSLPHSPDEMIKIDIASDKIAYRWQ